MANRRKSTRFSSVRLDDDRDASLIAPSVGGARGAPRSSSGASARNASGASASGSGSADIIPTLRRGKAATSAAAVAERAKAKAKVAAAPVFEDMLGDATKDADDSYLDHAPAPAQNGHTRARTASATAAAKGKAPARSASSAKRKRANADEEDEEPRKRARGAAAASAKKAEAASASARAVPYTSSRRIEELPADLIGETPIAKRNRARRDGLDGLGQPSSYGLFDTPGGAGASSSRIQPRGASGSAAGRRASLGLKGARRASSLRSGAVAHPHENVPDDMLYRHCSSELDPVGRMKYLLAWTLNRAVESVFTAAAAAAPPPDSDDADEPPTAKGKGKAKAKPKKGKAAAAPAQTGLSPQEEAEVLRKRKEIEGVLRRIMDQVIADIDEQEVSVSWLGRASAAGKQTTSGLKPHPRNGPNRAAEARLKAVGEAMQAEALAWESERQDLDEYEQRTAQLEQMLREGKQEELERLLDEERAARRAAAVAAAAGEEEEEEEDDGQEEAALLKEAEEVMQWAAALASGSMPDVPKKPAGRQSTKGKGKATQSQQLPEGVFELAGSEFDLRWPDVEFNIDMLRQHTHSYTQLSQLVERYLSAVSSRATQALKDSSAAAAAEASAALSSEAGGDKRKAQQNMAALMRGVNADRNAAPRSRAAKDAADAEPGEDSGLVLPAAADDSGGVDPADLLRALAGTGRAATRSAAASGSGAGPSQPRR